MWVSFLWNIRIAAILGVPLSPYPELSSLIDSPPTLFKKYNTQYTLTRRKLKVTPLKRNLRFLHHIPAGAYVFHEKVQKRFIRISSFNWGAHGVLRTSVRYRDEGESCLLCITYESTSWAPLFFLNDFVWKFHRRRATRRCLGSERVHKPLIAYTYYPQLCV